MYEQIIAGVVAGIGYSIVGWQKQPKKSKRKWDWGKLGKSVIVCGIVGGIAGYSNSDIGIMMTGTVGIGITKMVSLVIDLYKNRFKKKSF